MSTCKIPDWPWCPSFLRWASVVPGRPAERQVLVRGDDLEGGEQWMTIKDAAIYWDISARALSGRVRRLVERRQDDYELLIAEYTPSPPEIPWAEIMKQRARSAKENHPVLYPGWIERHIENRQEI